MRDITVCDLPESTLEALEQRARKYGRSLQDEIKLVLLIAAWDSDGISHADVAAASRAALVKTGRTYFGDSVEDVRMMREEHSG